MKQVQLGAIVGAAAGAELQEELEGRDSFSLFPPSLGREGMCSVWISQLVLLPPSKIPAGTVVFVSVNHRSDQSQDRHPDQGLPLL